MDRGGSLRAAACMSRNNIRKPRHSKDLIPAEQGHDGTELSGRNMQGRTKINRRRFFKGSCSLSSLSPFNRVLWNE